MTAAAAAASEIRLTTLHATRGANFWSTSPVTRMDVAVGAYDEISSADTPGVTERLVAALPGITEHQCSIGEPGGFVTRLRRGTYAPHIVEHVALELQMMIGHDVGFGRTRGGDVDGEYTIVFEHLHEQVGLRAAALALETVQRAFDGTLEPSHVAAGVRELAALAGTPDAPAVAQRVLAGVTGGAGRAECIAYFQEALGADHDEHLLIDVAPSFILYAGLPYARSRLAVILDTTIADVPPRYREPERARRLLSTVIDAVPRHGFIVCPAGEPELQEEIREASCRVAVFSTDDRVGDDALEIATAFGRVRDGAIWVEHCDDAERVQQLRPDRPASPQVAAALAAYVLRTETATR
ncbi:MAG: cyanophycin synthetase family protein [Gemmatimonadaceae bacterium]